MDPAVDRLILKSSSACRTRNGEISSLGKSDDPSYGSCLPNDAAFHRLVSQYAFAFAPTAMHAARTTGSGGFNVSIEAAYTSIDSGADYWKLGTRGAGTLADGNESNRDPARFLQLYSMKLRKGFGYGFELAAQSGFMPQTSLWSTGADVRVSLLEGFRKGIPGYLPDVAVGGGIRTITGTSQFQLTIASVDAQVSKPFVIGDSMAITPWLGFQEVFTFIDAHVTDFTPRTDESALCKSEGVALPGQVDNNEDGYTGRVVCLGSGADYNNNRTFRSARIERQRLIVGANLRYEILSVGASFVADLRRPGDVQNTKADSNALSGMPRQWTCVLDIGVLF
jgi:hypothetical protein